MNGMCNCARDVPAGTDDAHSNWSAVPAGVTGGPVQQITYWAQIIYMYHAHCYLRMLHTVAEKTYMYMYKVKGRRPVVL